MKTPVASFSSTLPDALPGTLPDALPSADRCWQAVLERDSQAHFFYAVLTTGIFCRPGCASRRPRRDNVRFFASPEEARTAGFRACRRCHPDDDQSPQQAAVIAACRQIEAGSDTELASLAVNAGMSRHHFLRLFRDVTGLTPKGYANACRDMRVRDRLAAGDDVTTALHAAGFGSSGRFYDRSQRILGMTPSQFRAGAPGEQIRFAIGNSSLGRVLAAATDRGVCAILLGDDDSTLIADLAGRFSRAEHVADDGALADELASVIQLVEQPGQPCSLPLDIRGTAFQQRVWQALREIPVGETASYSDIAERIGSPGASRAVAGACAANPVAIVVPCHRVVRGDGQLSGYRWGVERKRALLKREASKDKQ